MKHTHADAQYRFAVIYETLSKYERKRVEVQKVKMDKDNVRARIEILSINERE